MFEPKLRFGTHRLDPIAGSKRILSKRSLVELAKGIFKVLIVGYVSYITIAPEIPRIVLLADAGVGVTFQYIGYMVFRVGLHTALLLLIRSMPNNATTLSRAFPVARSINPAL